MKYKVWLEFEYETDETDENEAFNLITEQIDDLTHPLGLYVTGIEQVKGS